MRTEIVYVCSKDFRRYLFLSLRTLLTSGTDFDNVRVFVVDGGELNWEVSDDRIHFESVPDIASIGPWGYYWGTNKSHLCRSTAERVIYLDTDVMILRPLEQTYAGVETDLIARYGAETYRKRFWNESSWSESLENAGVPEFPFYSPGFMVFQNGAHERLQEDWVSMIERILRNDVPPLKPGKHAEMWAFSLAASKVGLSHYPMQNSHHRYAMIGEGHEDAVVYHLGTPGFYQYYLPIEKSLGLNDRTDIEVPRPSLTWAHSIWVQNRYRIKRRFRNKPRAATLDY